MSLTMDMAERQEREYTCQCCNAAVQRVWNNSPQPAATLVQACLDGSSSPIHGTVLSREQGLAHPQLAMFWEVVDFVLAIDPTVNTHLYRP